MDCGLKKEGDMQRERAAVAAHRPDRLPGSDEPGEPDRPMRRRSNVMKVNVTVTLDVDPVAWAIEFNLDHQRTNVIRKDVKTYFAGLCTKQLALLRCQADGERS
jgi:hypothetical protein